MTIGELQRSIDAIVVGASAGGVDALSQLLPAFARDARVAVLVVVHIPRERPSLLANVFGPICQLPVVEALDKQPLEPGRIYLAPPDYHLLVDDGPQLALSSDEPVHFSRPAIDVLFEAAADVFAERLLGVILSGANEDGAAGLRAVEAAGGVVVVQEPSEALAKVMPAAALARARSARPLSLDAIAALFAGIRDRTLHGF